MKSHTHSLLWIIFIFGSTQFGERNASSVWRNADQEVDRPSNETATPIIPRELVVSIVQEPTQLLNVLRDSNILNFTETLEEPHVLTISMDSDQLNSFQQKHAELFQIFDDADVVEVVMNETPTDVDSTPASMSIDVEKLHSLVQREPDILDTLTDVLNEANENELYGVYVNQVTRIKRGIEVWSRNMSDDHFNQQKFEAKEQHEKDEVNQPNPIVSKSGQQQFEAKEQHQPELNQQNFTVPESSQQQFETEKLHQPESNQQNFTVLESDQRHFETAQPESNQQNFTVLESDQRHFETAKQHKPESNQQNLTVPESGQLQFGTVGEQHQRELTQQNLTTQEEKRQSLDHTPMEPDWDEQVDSMHQSTKEVDEQEILMDEVSEVRVETVLAGQLDQLRDMCVNFLESATLTEVLVEPLNEVREMCINILQKTEDVMIVVED